MESLIKMQLAKKELMKRFMENYKKDGKERRTFSYYQKRLANLQEQWNDINSRHNEILQLSLDSSDELEIDYFAEDMFSDLEQNFILYYASIEDHFQRDFPPTTPEKTQEKEKVKTYLIPQPVKDESIRLPRIELPKFIGDYRSWPSFHDLFKTLVHDNKAISAVQKLHYLKAHLSGEPEHLLRHFQITDNNYDAAWKLLIDRYDNKRILIHAQLKVLLSQNSVTSENSQGVKSLLDTTSECLQALENLEIDITGWDVLMVYIIVQKLPPETHQLWEQSLSSRKDHPTWKELRDFLEGRFRTLEAIVSKKTNVQFSRDQRFHREKPTKSHTFTLTKVKCSICPASHSTTQCNDFKQMPHAKKLETVRSKGLCLNCLAQGHIQSDCPSKFRCLHCSAKHHTLLHKHGAYESKQASCGEHVHQTEKYTVLKAANQSHPNIVKESKFSKSGTNDLQLNSTQINGSNPAPGTSTGDIFRTYFVKDDPCPKQVLLATALVKVESITGTHTLRALIDQGSQASFITEAAVQRLKLKKETVSASITGLNQINTGHIRSKVQFVLKSSKNNDLLLNVNGFVLRNLTNLLPNQKIQIPHWNQLIRLDLADPTFHMPGRIDLLLGADVFAQIILDGLIKDEAGHLIAQRTLLGWILSGETSEKRQNLVEMQSYHTTLDLNEQIKKFWELEEIENVKILSQEETTCEEHFKESYRRLSDGRYEVGLPFWNDHDLNLGKSRDIAICRLHQMENRFKKDPELHKHYSTCIQEYLDLNHMKLVTTSEEDNVILGPNGRRSYASCYLPHHAVIKESSSTTKLRVVFDASRKTTSGISLNDTLMKGPTIQDELPTLLLRWRQYKIAFMADAEKMYRQVKIDPKCTNYQRIVWRTSTDHPIKDYALTTVTFGTKSAPFLAVRVLKQLALDEEAKYPIGADAILNDMYVDDLISGANDLQTSLEKQDQIVSIMKSGGFLLRKWASNCPAILECLPPAHRETNVLLEVNTEENLKALGVKWNPSTDEFSYKLNLDPHIDFVTKRIILSEVSKLFDPLGWLAPVMILGKIMIQKLWLLGLGWDDQVPIEVEKEWTTFRNKLVDIIKIRIPRWTGMEQSVDSIEFHGFSDASQKAYAAVIYLCIESKNGRKISMLAAKSKVSPIKTVSLPRLELCGAVLLAKLMKYVLTSMKLPNAHIYTWTDSEIVISWLKAHPSKWKTFVANRVSHIYELLGENVWRHIRSKDNPADLATRGLSPVELKNNEIWWSGPDWLKSPESHWPQSSNCQTTQLETRNIASLHIVQNDEFDLTKKYSSLLKLCRVTAYLFRFIEQIRPAPSSNKQKSAHLDSMEIDRALKFWIRRTQQSKFATEFRCLEAEKVIPTKSSLLKLNPFLHSDGTLRVLGRLHEADLTYDEKHPLILPQKSYLTNLIISHTHRLTFHGGPQLMMATLRKRFWILNCRNTVKSFIHQCIICHKQKMNTRSQLMGNLPAYRVRKSRPFEHVGVDYCGPFEIRASKLRNSKFYKGYVAIFVCMATKAIHIEIVSDLSSLGFLAAFRRFVSRRGLCSNIYSDCGSNFIGANALLTRQKEQMITTLNEDIAAAVANEGVVWHFVPPASPNFGGLWEAGVKSTKFHLKRVAGQSRLTFEELNTLLTQIEACLNSRPLCEMTHDPQDLTPLTPGHFLIGDSLVTPPEPSILDLNLNALDRWHRIQHMYQSFWSRWSTEYLSRLQQRPKWNRVEPNMAVGDLVIIKDERLPPSRWLMARIINIHPGQDGLVRVVSLKTKESLLKRPISKLCLLPMNTRNTN